MSNLICLGRDSNKDQLANEGHQHNYWRSRSNEGLFWAMNNLHNDTVQTSWRPQLPLPKDSTAKSQSGDRADKSMQNKKSSESTGKWSLGRLFRRKKEVEVESSSEEDRKAGFSPSQKQTRRKEKRSSRAGFDHIIAPPNYQLDQRSPKDVNGNRQEVKRNGASSGEDVSLDLSAKYRSDESLGSAGFGSNYSSRRSRSARNERYYKRLSRDGETPCLPLPPAAPQHVHRFKTQPIPLSVFKGYPVGAKNLQNGMSNNKKSISYDNYIHLHNLQRHHDLPHTHQPPPPPPRDPLRKVQMGSLELRHSYGEQTPPPNAMYSKLSGRCVSDDKLWNAHLKHVPQYNRPSSTQPPPTQHRRFISRDIPRTDFKYVAESTPRSRKPISIVDDNGGFIKSPVRTSKSGLVTNTEQMYAVPHKNPARPAFSLYANAKKPVQPKEAKSVDEVDFVNNNVVHGSLQLRPVTKPKSQSMPNYYQQKKPRSPFEAERKIREIFKKKSSPQPQVKETHVVVAAPPKKETNLDDAINELEAIYKSLKMGDTSVEDPVGFETYVARAEEYMDDDEDSPAGEPDVVLDDVAYRSNKHANSMLKTAEKQPPFGIPLQPIPPSPRSDYLHVKPDKTIKQLSGTPHYYPDVITDDLAVRTWRKDAAGVPECTMKNSTQSYPPDCYKKKRATRTQSANIVNLIHRDAAKPCGGNLKDYFGSNRTLDRCGSLTDLYNDENAVELLKTLTHKDESPKHIPFRHPSQGGAIMNLPKVLQTKPTPLPRKSITPDIDGDKVLEKIAQEARESSEKLSRDLENLKKKDDPPPPPPRRLPSEEDLLNAIEEVSKAASKISTQLQSDLGPESPQSVDLVIPSFLQKLDPSSQKISEIAARCMRQISELDDLSSEYNSLGTVCNKTSDLESVAPNEPSSVPGEEKISDDKTVEDDDDDIETIMRECEEQVKAAAAATAAIVKSQDENSTTETGGEIFFSLEDRTSFTSSSDCLKSSSPTNHNNGAQQSSSITSFNPYSSSDYVKSPSSDYHLPSTDPIKTFSTTSYDVQSTPNQLTAASSPFSTDDASDMATPPPPPSNCLETGNADASISNPVRESEYASNLSHASQRFHLDPIFEDDSVSFCSESFDEISEMYIRPHYSNNISIPIVVSCPDEDATQFDSLSSNEDSGNSSLSDFPPTAAHNRIDLTLDHNGRYEMRPEFVSEVSIPTRMDEEPSTSRQCRASRDDEPNKSSTLTLFAQQTSQNGLTFLENLALACVLGYVSNDDLITLLAVIIAVITIIAFALI